MKTTTRTVRLLSATAAAVVTATLFSGVISFSEPQRSVLVAATQQRSAVAAAHATPTVAMLQAGKTVR